MKKAWDDNNFRKLFQLINDEKKQKKTIHNLLNENEDIEFIIDQMKYAFEHDYADFLDMFSEMYDDIHGDMKESFVAWVLENSDFQNEEDLYHELETYQFFKTTVLFIGQYMNMMSSQEAVTFLESQNLEHLEDVSRYLLAKYYHQNKCNKDDFIGQKTKEGTILRAIVNGYFDKNLTNLQTFAQENYQYDLQQQKQVLEKKIEKTVGKARKKLIKLLSDSMEPMQLCDELQRLQYETFQKIETYIGQNYQDYQQVISLQTDFNTHIQQTQTLISSLDSQIEEEEQTTQQNCINEYDLNIIEDFYRENHLYYKKSQIIQELTENPFVIDFYHFYNQILLLEDKEETIGKLDELVSDIRESGLKNKEILRRLLSVAHKKSEDFIEEEEIEEFVEESIPMPSHHSDEVIKIGKFLVLKDSVQDNPVDLQKIISLLAVEDHHEMNWLKSLVYQIGYDKVHGYLLKSPGMPIYDLQTIIQLDRSLRFEYQRILEDIEMYFRSTFTYFLANKYDQKYLMVENFQPFYKRGYLIGNLFSDYQEHYEHVKLLRERIDDEMKNNNLQVIEEYKRYKYALPFSTAAGIMTFGWIINLFENLNYYDKSEYLRNYFQRLTPQTFYCWMMSLSNLRNRCAHYQSLYRLSSLKELRPIMTKDVDGNGYDDDIKHSSLFYYTLIMTRLSPSVSNIEDFIDNIGILVRKVSRESMVFDFQKDYSFPKNWRMMLENEKSSKMNFNHELL